MIIDSATLTEAKIAQLSATHKYFIYNALDCCLTLDIFHTIKPQFDNNPNAKLVYDFERGMQAPALAMMRRGFAIDAYQRRLGIDSLKAQKARLEHILNCYGNALWGKPLNANAPKQIRAVLYDVMGLPKVELSFKGVRRVTVNREALEKLESYYQAEPVIKCILAVRDTTKLLSTISSAVDDDGRMRTMYSVAGTETGRWSSSANAFGRGTNLQNITPELRQMFIADPGKKLGYLDLEQAESWIVGLLVWALVGDSAYLDAIKSGDLHTYVARILWPHIKSRADADKPFYRHFSHRDMSKRGGHASNYRVTPPTMSRTLKIPLTVCKEFQPKYFGVFPGIPLWHQWTAQELGINRSLVTLLGRLRHFFGRAYDDATLREAIAFVPQSCVGDILNIVLHRMWRDGFEILAQIHDAVVFQFPEAEEAKVFARAKELARVPILAHSVIDGSQQEIVIPAECKSGWNWADDEIRTAHGVVQNPGGLKKWKGLPDERRRLTGLDRVVS